MFLFVWRALWKKSKKQFSYVFSLHPSTTGSCFNVWCWRVHLHLSLSLSLSSYSFSLPPSFHCIQFSHSIRIKESERERDPFSFHFLLPLSCFISSLGDLFYSIVSIIYHHLFIVIYIFLHMHCRFDQCLSNVGFCICRRYIWEIIIWIRLR